MTTAARRIHRAAVEYRRQVVIVPDSRHDPPPPSVVVALRQHVDPTTVRPSGRGHGRSGPDHRGCGGEDDGGENASESALLHGRNPFVERCGANDSIPLNADENGNDSQG